MERVAKELRFAEWDINELQELFYKSMEDMRIEKCVVTSSLMNVSLFTEL